MKRVALKSIASVSLGVFYGKDAESMLRWASLVLDRLSIEEETKIVAHGGWYEHNGRMHLGYLVENDRVVTAKRKEQLIEELLARAESEERA